MYDWDILILRFQSVKYLTHLETYINIAKTYGVVQELVLHALCSVGRVIISIFHNKIKVLVLYVNFNVLLGCPTKNGVEFNQQFILHLVA